MGGGGEEDEEEVGHKRGREGGGKAREPA